MELDKKVYAEIKKLSKEGNKLCDREAYQDAAAKFRLALQWVPDPKTIWEASTWLYMSLGDTLFLAGQYAEAVDCLCDALNCPDGNTNSFVLLRLGQVLYEMGELNKSKEYLLRAYMLEGKEIFDDEDDKYFSAISDIV